MNETQLAEIRNYLISKKLPIDILIEVQDHFISQIQNFQIEENLSFENAFEKTKNSWQEELKLYWDGSLNLDDSSKFKKKIERQVWFSVINKTLFYCLIIVFALFLIANFLNSTIFKYFITSIMLLATAFPPLFYFINLKKFKLIKKYDNYVLSLYQMPSVIFLSVLGVALTYIPNTFKNSDLLYQLFSFKSGFQNTGFAVGSAFIIFTGIMIFISQKEYLKRIEKVKPFLQFLKPNN